uniref:SMB domain-containing protein n=1 Tax=Branchiostoma floridae TaxID=7739 RepID=C3YBL5_BRAFL|eukprot:XP_002606362.1 hypothetical protein BRAFLDRAFT_67605 [Branchiostoma floridae]
MRTMSLLGLCVLLLATFVYVESQQQPNLVFREPPRAVTDTYCSLLNCCRGRSDSCSLPYFDTICYCDEFCNRTSASDCCPDYRSVCLGLPPPNEPTPLPQPPETDGCFHDGTYHPGGATVRINCNQCVCQPNQAGSYEFRCQENPCLLRPTMLEAINQGDYGWQAEAYPFLYGLTLDQGLRYKLGTDPVPESVHAMRGIQLYSNVVTNDVTTSQVSIRENLPEFFDARQRWPGLIQDVRDQGNCGASWAFSTTAVLADRLAIQSRGTMTVTLSPQNLLSCNTNRQRGCQGGRLDRAWWFLRKKGFPVYEVTDDSIDERWRLLRTAVFTTLLLAAVTTAVSVTITVQFYSDTAAEKTAAGLPPYRNRGHGGVPDGTIATDATAPPPTNDPMTPPTAHVRRRDDKPDVHRDWDSMTARQKHWYLSKMRLRISKHMHDLLHLQDEPKVQKDLEDDILRHFTDWDVNTVANTFSYSESPTDVPEYKMNQPKSGSSIETRSKSELENTEATAVDKVLLEKAREMNLYLSSVMTTNMTDRERKHRVFRRVKRVTTVAMIVVGVLVAGSVAYSFMPQIF